MLFLQSITGLDKQKNLCKIVNIFLPLFFWEIRKLYSCYALLTGITLFLYANMTFKYEINYHMGCILYLLYAMNDSLIVCHAQLIYFIKSMSLPVCATQDSHLQSLHDSL